MEEKVNAVVLKSVDYGENDKILTLFTLEKGVISARIKGVKKPSAKLKVFAEPFCFSEYILVSKNSFHTVINASVIESYYSVRLDIEKFYAGNSVMEFIRKLSPENVIASDLFALTVQTFRNMEKGENIAFSLLSFFIGAVGEIGYGIDVDGCAECGNEDFKRPFFDFSNGQVYCEKCAEDKKDPVEISYKTFSLLKEPSSFSAESYKEYLFRALKLMSRYIATVTGEEIKSLKEYLFL